MSSSDDDEEETAAAEAMKKEGDEGEENEVKMDIDAPPKIDPYQFYWYTPEELEGFSQRQLVADVALYEGEIFFLSRDVLFDKIFVTRTSENGQAKHGCTQAVSQTRTGVLGSSSRSRCSDLQA